MTTQVAQPLACPVSAIRLCSEGLTTGHVVQFWLVQYCTGYGVIYVKVVCDFGMTASAKELRILKCQPCEASSVLQFRNCRLQSRGVARGRRRPPCGPPVRRYRRVSSAVAP